MIFIDVSIKKILKNVFFVLQQAIQDITRNRDILPEEVVALIFEKIDVKRKGESQFIYENPHL